MTITVFILPGAFGKAADMPAKLQGAVCNGNLVIPVNYPNNQLAYFPAPGGGLGFSTDDPYTAAEVSSKYLTATLPFMNQALEMLDYELTTTPGPKVVFGHSLGAAVGTYWLSQIGPTSDVSPDELAFVFTGNSMRTFGGGFVRVLAGVNALPYMMPLNTPYTVTDVARQYDGWADWPTSDSNFTDWTYAAMNAQQGQNKLHPFYDDVSLTDPTNVYYKRGNITWIINPTLMLPMADNWFVTPTMAQYMDTQYRPLIEGAYPDHQLFGTLPTPDFAPPPPPVFPPAATNDLPWIDRRNYDSIMIPYVPAGGGGSSSDTGTQPTIVPAKPTVTDIAVQLYDTLFHAPSVPITLTEPTPGTFILSVEDVNGHPPNGGMFTLGYNGKFNGVPLIYTNSGQIMADAMQIYLEALPTVGWGNVVVDYIGGTNQYQFAFNGNVPAGSLQIGDNTGTSIIGPGGVLGGVWTDVTSVVDQGVSAVTKFVDSVFHIPSKPTGSLVSPGDTETIQYPQGSTGEL